MLTRCQRSVTACHTYLTIPTCHQHLLWWALGLTGLWSLDHIIELALGKYLIIYDSPWFGLGIASNSGHPEHYSGGLRIG